MELQHWLILIGYTVYWFIVGWLFGSFHGWRSGWNEHIELTKFVFRDKDVDSLKKLLKELEDKK